MVGIQVVQVFQVAEAIRWIFNRRAGDPIGTVHTDHWGCTWTKVNETDWETHDDCDLPPGFGGGETG